MSWYSGFKIKYRLYCIQLSMYYKNNGMQLTPMKYMSINNNKVQMFLIFIKIICFQFMIHVKILREEVWRLSFKFMLE